MKDISSKFSSIMKKGKKFLKDNGNKMALYTTMLALGAGGTMYSTQAKGQIPESYKTTKATQADSLWGANNSTPDSVAWNMYSRPNIVKTYGKQGADPNLDWDSMSASDKYNYFAKVVGDAIKVYSTHNKIDGNGNTIMSVNGAECYDYTNWINYLITGENNISNDPGTSINWSQDIRDTTIANNAKFNLPGLGVNGTSNLGPHSVSGVYLAHRVNDTTTLKSLGLRDSQTNYDASPGTDFLAKTGTVDVYWYGYQNGKFVQNKLMEFGFDKNGNSKLLYANPKLYMVDPKTVQLKTESPGNKTINYTDAWKNYVGKFKTTVNQDTTQRVNTDDGAGTTVSFKDYLKNTLTVSKTPLMSGEAGKYNFVEKRKNLVEFIQDGFQTDFVNYNGKHFYTQIKVDSATQTITVRDMEAPTGDLRKNDTTVMSKANALEAALAMVENVKDNSNGTVNITDTITSDSDSLRTYLMGLQDVTGNYKKLGFVDVHFGTTGINNHKAVSDKYGIQKVWPNPFMQSKGNNLFFDYKAKASGPVEIDFIDLSGRKVMTYTKQIEAGINLIEISVPNINPGTYLLNCGGQRVKVVVQ